MKKKLFVLLLSLTISTIYVFSSELIDGIWYNLNNSSHTATVTSSSYYMSYYSGSVVIPSTITFRSATYSVTGITSDAFRECTGLTSVTIPNSITYIGGGAFYGTISLISINVDAENPNYFSLDGVLFCASYMVIDYSEDDIYILSDTALIKYPCAKQKSEYTITNNVKCIGFGAFSDCTSLTSIEIPNSVINIEAGAFSNCKSLTSIEIPNSVTSIGDETFSYCTSLTSVTINSNTIVDETYTYKDNISSIFGPQVTEYILGDSVTSIGDCAFADCTGLTSVMMGNNVTSIGNGAFSSCSGMTSITIGNSVTSIGSRAFANCTGLTSAIIGNNVTCIGNNAFVDCTRLTSIEIPNSVTIIGERAFYRCKSLASVTIGNSVKSIESEAFEGCISLNSVYISDVAAWCNISFISNPLSYAHNLYLNNELITTLVIPDSVTNISDDAFKYCSNLTSVEISNSVISIGSQAFRECHGLISVTIGNGVKSFGERTFAGCISLTSISMGNSVEDIGSLAFYRCINLTSINVDNNNPYFSSLDGVLFNKDKSCLIQYPEGKQGEYTIPDGVISIGKEAFYYCSGLTSIIIPNSVSRIESHAFYNCSGLTSITCFAVTPPKISNDRAFDNHSIPLYVPWGSIYFYKNAYEWESFNNILGIEDEDPMAADAINENQKRSSKLLRDGHILILRGDNIYTLTGQKVK